MMRQVKDPRAKYDYQVRTIGCGGETLGEELLEWGKEVFGITINEFYCQTEVNLVVGNCYEVMEVRPGSMGRAIPGHVVEVVNEVGEILPPGEVGEVAIKSPDPSHVLGILGEPASNQGEVRGDMVPHGRSSQEG
jgi:acetyl-CoA synthetase